MICMREQSVIAMAFVLFATCTPELAAQTTSHDAVIDPVSGFKDLFRNLGTDFRNLPSIPHLEIAAIGGTLAWLGHGLDGHVTSRIHEDAYEEILDGGAELGGAAVQFGGAMGAYLLGRATHEPVLAHVGANLVEAQIVSGVLVQGIKFSVRRTRPDGTTLSFPSGHSAAAFATATVLERNFGWRVGVPSYAAAMYVAASRVQERRHYVSDVVFGGAIGVIAGHSVTIGHGHSAFFVSPVALPGGGGIMFARKGQ
jgi:membrane-associated phospholipid phosphatase